MQKYVLETGPAELDLKEWLAEVRPELAEELQQRIDEVLVPFRNTGFLYEKYMSTSIYCLTSHIFRWMEDYPDLLPGFMALNVDILIQNG